MEEQLASLAKLLRYYILTMTTAAGSGHPTSSLSAVELMTVLFFNYFRFDLDNLENPNNDRLIFSKGHATPLFYSLYAVAGKITEQELLRYRKFDSNLQGHPMPDFPYTEVPTGSLGQGLSVGVGEALALRFHNSPLSANTDSSPSYLKRGLGSVTIPNVFVLLGDGEMTEGSVWEAIQYAGFQKLDNLVALLDVNRLGQSDETMVGSDIEKYRKRVESFGWQVIIITDGHNLELIDEAFAKLSKPHPSPLPETRFAARRASSGQALTKERELKPTMIIAKTIKGKGFSEWEDKNGFHSKPLPQEKLELALKELGLVDKSIRGTVQKPPSHPDRGDNRVEGSNSPAADVQDSSTALGMTYTIAQPVPTKKAFGNAIERLGKFYPKMMVLDGDIKNSLHTDQFAKSYPNQFLQMYIAEQNMVGVASGLAQRGFKPVVTTFACFMTRAHDQIRMAALGGLTIIFNGSYAGVSLGKDGPSQMGLDDLGLFRSLLNSTVLYPADGVATEKLFEKMLGLTGIVYLRTTREPTPILYSETGEFAVGGSKVFDSIHNSPNSPSYLKRGLGGVTLVAAGITVHEALKAQKELEKLGIGVTVIDCYSIKPIDTQTLQKAAAESQAIITVEDHYAQGGLGDAVLEALAEIAHPPIYKLAVTKLPRSGRPEELLDYEGISATKIVEKVKSIISR
ncbi:TPA: transketolase [Patescibacteria group bacterium]|uniref:Transketolase n=1 Tax=Candidatus Gottesmanbacteria bacterium GW2011_GWA1_43_11 TaxID=1618436 RepID=A0A0G1EQB0_9BACT|nr:MAG: Transketolase [Candidatus Gottesmanbacteria bacterium GW2011_GWA1_43_11]HCS79419.1 transketolase [Patescibacteria group bacterium]